MNSFQNAYAIERRTTHHGGREGVGGDNGLCCGRRREPGSPQGAPGGSDPDCRDLRGGSAPRNRRTGPRRDPGRGTGRPVREGALRARSYRRLYTVNSREAAKSAKFGIITCNSPSARRPQESPPRVRPPVPPPAGAPR